jgi:hypothetical protein
MDKRKYLLAFMIGLAAALGLSAAFSRSSVLQGKAAPLISLTGEQGSGPEITTPTYDILWYTIDGGGGAGSGGPYEMNYTIGQPDFSVLSGSPYSLQDGFWPGKFQFWNTLLPLISK